MNKRDLILSLTENEQIILRPYGPYQVSDLYCCDVIRVLFYKNNGYRLLPHTTFPILHEWLTSFCRLLVAGMAKELILPEPINKNIGYCYNQYLQEWRNGRKIEDMSICDFKLCFYSDAATFMYNNENGDIVLEIAPIYRWGVKKRIKNFLPYKVFLRRYRPLNVVTIPTERAYVCLRQAIELINAIQSNSDRLSRQYDSKAGIEYKPPIVKIPPIIWALHEGLQYEMSTARKNIFIQAGFSEYAYWWESLTDRQRESLLV